MFSKNALAVPKSETEVVSNGRVYTLIPNLIKLPLSSFLNNQVFNYFSYGAAVE